MFYVVSTGKVEVVPITEVVETQVLNTEQVKRFGGSIVGGLAAGAFFGVAGATAGALSFGNSQQVTFLIRFRGDGLLVVNGPSEVYNRIVAFVRVNKPNGDVKLIGEPPATQAPPGGLVALVSIVVVFISIAFCCLLPFFGVKTPKHYHYYNFNPSIDVAWLKENERIPEPLRNALNQAARELVEKRWPVTETQIRSSKPFSQNTNCEEFTVLVILDDGKEWLKREGFWVSLIVDITLDTPDQQAESLKITGIKNAGFGH